MKTKTDHHQPFSDLHTRAQAIKKGDDVAVKALITEMLAAPLSDERRDMLMRSTAKASGFALATVRRLAGGSGSGESGRPVLARRRRRPSAPLRRRPRRRRKSFETPNGKGSGRTVRTWRARPTS